MKKHTKALILAGGLALQCTQTAPLDPQTPIAIFEPSPRLQYLPYSAFSSQPGVTATMLINILNARDLIAGLTLDTVQTPQSQKNWQSILALLGAAASAYDTSLLSPETPLSPIAMTDAKEKLMQLHTKITDLFKNIEQKIRNKKILLETRKELLKLYESMTSDWQKIVESKALFHELPKEINSKNVIPNLRSQLAAPLLK